MNLLTLILGLHLGCNKTTEKPQDDISDIADIPTPSADIPEDTGIIDQPNEERETKYYSFNDSDSLLYVQVYKDQSAAAAGLAHDHVMRASNWDGFVSYNQSDIDECAMQFSLPVVDLQVDEDVMREYVGYGDTISASDRATIREHMLADNQLDAARNPTISFVSSDCELVDEATLRVTGDMAIKNTVREWQLDVDFTSRSDSFYASSVINFTHSDFNITPYSAFFGAVKNDEPLKITFDIVGYEE